MNEHPVPIVLPDALATQFREAMSHLAQPVHVVTTDGPQGRAGLTASSVTSVSDTPPLMLVCVDRGSRTAAKILANGVFCINSLAAEHLALAEDFSGRTGLLPQERFRRGLWEALVTGAPMLADALAAFDCRLTEARLVATHYVLF